MVVRLVLHEIRTPLNGIIGPVELLKKTYNIEDISTLVDILDISVRRLEKFSLEALLITRLKTNPYEIKGVEIDLAKLISKVLEDEKGDVESKELKIKYKYESANNIVIGEPQLIEKSLVNVFKNAIQYSPQKGSVETVVLSRGDDVILQISNEGEGFPASILEHAFELFTSGSGHQDSRYGIGLPVAKLIMEAHNGDVRIKNRKQGGACVQLVFRHKDSDQMII